MKAIAPVTFVQMCLFLATQYVGIVAIWTAVLDPSSSYFSFIATVEPFVNYVILLVGSTVILLIVATLTPQRFGVRRWMPALYRMLVIESAVFCVSITLWVFISAAGLPSLIAVAVGSIMAVWKFRYPSVISDNLEAILLNAGAAVLLVYAGIIVASMCDIPAQMMPTVIIPAVLVAMTIIAVGDYLTVRSGRMISLAKFTLHANAFTGLKISRANEGVDTYDFTDAATGRALAIISGGDIIAPLIFASGILSVYGLLWALVVPLFVSVGLAVLLITASKGRGHPAMPAITISCFVAWLVVLLAHYAGP